MNLDWKLEDIGLRLVIVGWTVAHIDLFVVGTGSIFADTGWIVVHIGWSAVDIDWISGDIDWTAVHIDWIVGASG